MSSLFDLLSGLLETKENKSNIKEPETMKRQEKTDTEEMTQVEDVMEEVYRADKNTQNATEVTATVEVPEAPTMTELEVPEVPTTTTELEVPETPAEPKTPAEEVEEESLEEILSKLPFAERKEVMRSNFLRIWEEKAQEYYEENSTQSIEETNKRISALEGTIAKERQQLQELQKKVDDYSELNQLMKLGGKDLPVEEEKAQIESIISNLEIKERELAELQAELEKNHSKRLEQALEVFMDEAVLSECWSSETFKEEYDGYRERFIESTEYIRGLCKSPLYQKLQRDDEKHLVDSYIRWADIQNRILKLFVNPARIYEDGSYELNPDFKKLHNDICNHPFDMYNVNYRAEKWLNGLCSDIPYVKYLLIIRGYIREYCYNRTAGIYSDRSVKSEVSCYIQCMQFDCIIFNQFLRECQKNGTDYNEIFGAYEQDFDSFLVDIEEVWRKDGEIRLWGLLWDGIEVEDELIEYLFDVDMYTLHDVNRYIAMYLQFSADYSNDAFHTAGGTYLYSPLPEGNIRELSRRCAKDLGIEAYKLRKSLSCLAPSRLRKRVTFYGTKGAKKFLEDEVKKCQNL